VADGRARHEALYHIAEAAASTDDLPAFYAALHGVVAELMPADCFCVALYDAQRQRVNWPYYRATADLDIPDPEVWEPIGEGPVRGLTSLVLQTGETQHVATGAVDWLGTPLTIGGRTFGAVVVCASEARERYTAEDAAVITFVARHIALALDRVRTATELRRRNDELTLVNEIGQALASSISWASGSGRCLSRLTCTSRCTTKQPT
jgi:GAF domain-containing protein